MKFLPVMMIPFITVVSCVFLAVPGLGFQDLNANGGETRTVLPLEDFDDFERDFGLKMLADSVRDSKGLANQIVAPYGLFDCLHFVSNVTRAEIEQEMSEILFESGDRKQLLGESVELRRVLKPREGYPAPPLVAKNFLLYDHEHSLTNNGRPEALNLFDVDAFPMNWGQPTPGNAAARSIEESFEKIASGRIKDFAYEPPSLRPGSLLFLNLCYFKDRWFNPFDASKTRPGIFHLAGGQHHSADFMRDTGRSGKWLENEFFKLVEVPYGSMARRTSMVLVLPHYGVDDSNVIDELRKLNCLADVSERPQWRTPTVKYDIMVPKFKVKKKAELNQFCRSIGINSIFDADTGIGERLIGGEDPDLRVSKIEQDAFIQFDEKGTEALAKTEVQIEVFSLPDLSKEQNKEFFADRPFLFFIVDKQGVMYFAGKVSQPNWD